MSTALRAIVLDTDVASQSFKRRPAPILNRLVGFDPVITFVTRAELTKWAEVQLGSAQPPAPGDLAGRDADPSRWRCRRGRLGRPGCCGEQAGPATSTERHVDRSCLLGLGLPLATLNVKDYTDFAEFHALELIIG